MRTPCKPRFYVYAIYNESNNNLCYYGSIKAKNLQGTEFNAEAILHDFHNREGNYRMMEEYDPFSEEGNVIISYLKDCSCGFQKRMENYTSPFNCQKDPEELENAIKLFKVSQNHEISILE